MKKIISLLLSIILIMISINVYAAESKIDILGDTSIKINETKTLIAKITTSGDSIGVISADISYSENISKVEVIGKNGWQVTYNPSNGKVNALKAEGTKNEDFMEIKYTLKSDEKENATIKIDNITVSTIEYNSESIGNIIKNITIQKDIQKTKELSEIVINKKPNKINYTEGEKVNNDGLIVIAKYNDGTSTEIKNYKYSPMEELKLTDKKVEISYTENFITKKVSYDITVTAKITDEKEESKEETKEDIKEDKKEETREEVNDDTLVNNNNKLPQTGVLNYVLISALSIMLGIVIICYFKYKRYKIN